MSTTWEQASDQLMQVANQLGYDVVVFVDKNPRVKLAELDEETQKTVQANDYLDGILAASDETEVFSTKKYLLAAGMIISNVASSDNTAINVLKYGVAHAKAELAGMQLMFDHDNSRFDYDNEDEFVQEDDSED